MADEPADGAPAPQPTPVEPPPTRLVWAVLVACLCFLPLGLVSVAFAWRTSVLNRAGRLDQARRTSRAAKGWIIATVVIGVIVDLVLITALALLGAFGTPA